MAQASVLTNAAALPSRAALERAARELFSGTSLEWDERELLTVAGLKVRVVATPAPVPNAEADTAAFLSPSSLDGRWRLARHAAHLVLDGGPGSTLEPLTSFTRAVAVVTQAVGALGVFWGAAPVTHAPDFFVAMARERLPLPAWVGVSITPEAEGRTSALSFGMRQLGLPELLLCAEREELPDAMDFFYSALATIAERGRAPSEGERIPRSLLSRPRVRYVPSPVDEQTRVWRLEL